MDEALKEKGTVLLIDKEIPQGFEEPKTLKQALECPHFREYWKAAAGKEFQQLVDTKTLNIIDRKEGAKLNLGRPLRLKWVFKIKALEHPL
jgi:hypothetical protein